MPGVCAAAIADTLQKITPNVLRNFAMADPEQFPHLVGARLTQRGDIA